MIKVTTPKPFVFVLMPFDKKFDDVYELGIKTACNNVNAYAERVDEQIYKESILERIYNQIDKADIIVADLTGRNPNVFYETGYAHALGKQVILLTQKADDIPFDLKHYYHIVYGGRIKDLIPELQKRINWFIEKPENELLKREYVTKFYIEGYSIDKSPIIPYYVKKEKVSRVLLKIDSHNEDDLYIQTIKYKIGVVTSTIFQKSSTFEGKRLKTIKLPNGSILHLYNNEIKLLPGEWESCQIYFNVSSPDSFLQVGDKIRLKVRVTSDIGSIDYPFELNFKYGLDRIESSNKTNSTNVKSRTAD